MGLAGESLHMMRQGLITVSQVFPCDYITRLYLSHIVSRKYTLPDPGLPSLFLYRIVMGKVRVNWVMGCSLLIHLSIASLPSPSIQWSLFPLSFSYPQSHNHHIVSSTFFTPIMIIPSYVIVILMALLLSLIVLLLGLIVKTMYGPITLDPNLVSIFQERVGVDID